MKVLSNGVEAFQSGENDEGKKLNASIQRNVSLIYIATGGIMSGFGSRVFPTACSM